eukprot:Filipodium_phascolosomae@DN2053_c0_g1_i1.p1
MVIVATKSKDNVFVRLAIAIQRKIKTDTPEDIYNGFYKLSDPSAQVESYVIDVVRSSVPKLDLDEIFEAKAQLSITIRTTLQTSLSASGYDIIQVLITDVDPALNVKQCMCHPSSLFKNLQQ